MRLLKWLAVIVLSASLLMLAAGIYRFNFTNDDVYIQLPDGSVTSLDEYEKQRHD